MKASSGSTFYIFIRLIDKLVISLINSLNKVDNFQVTYLEPGQSSEIEGKNSSKVGVRATAGPVLGPPWQRPENG